MKNNYAKRFLRAAGLLAVAVFGGSILAQAQTLTTIYSFTGNGDGQSPHGQHLTFDNNGALYGTTQTNTSNPQWGTVFQLVPPMLGGGAWKENTLYNFQGWYPTGDGAQPQTGVVLDQNGNVYGATAYGGNGGASGGGGGVIYEVSPEGGAWKEKVLYIFEGYYDGWRPGEVVLGPNGSLFGTTYLGGTSGFHITRAWETRTEEAKLVAARYLS